MGAKVVSNKWPVTIPKGATFRRQLQIGRRANKGDEGAVLGDDRRTWYIPTDLTAVEDIEWELWPTSKSDEIVLALSVNDGITITDEEAGTITIEIPVDDVNTLPLTTDGRHAIHLTWAGDRLPYTVGPLEIVLPGVSI